MQAFTLTYPWDENGCCPDVRFELGRNEEGFTMHIIVQESDPRREVKQHFGPVCQDSCVEWFVNFMPEVCDRYFNFEVNAAGVMNVSFRKDRYDSKYLTQQDVEALKIRTAIYETHWEVFYTVPFELIRHYIPGYEFLAGRSIQGNFYKCGDLTERKHYGVWNLIALEKPDFHRPEYFGDIVVD